LKFISNPIAVKNNWNNKDFVIYFSNKLREKTGSGLEIPKEAWFPYISRIKGFRTKLKLNDKDYKEFVDKVVDVFFAQPGYVPAFGAIVSEKVFYTVKKINKTPREFTNNDFIKLRDNLFKDLSITFRINE
jgi:hypothetical protein